MLDKLENFDSGSNYRFGDKLETSPQKRSLFDLSHTVATTYPREGYIMPVSFWETLPGDSYDISIDALLRFQPLVVPPYSRSRIFFYAFFSYYSDLWSNWQVFMSRGHSGQNQDLVPRLNSYNCSVSDSSAVLSKPDSMLNFMGIPLGVKFSDFAGSNAKIPITSLPFMMNFRVWRDYFCSKDEYIWDSVLFPDDDSRFRLNNKGQLMSALDVNSNGRCYFVTDNSSYDGKGYSSVNSYTKYFTDMWHEWANDYFVSSKPFMQRGVDEGIPVNFNLSRLALDAENSTFFSSFGDSLSDANFNYDGNSPFKTSDSDNISDANILFQDFFSNIGLRDTQAGQTDIPLAKISISDMRLSIINQLELERLAHTDGTYAQFGIAFFNRKSKRSQDYRPIYIGGTVKPILFSQILQTSQTVTSGSNPSVLGSYAGNGISSVKNGYLGHFECDDYGLISVYAVILPDTYYSQGLDKRFTRLTQEEFFLSGREKLGMQPILNREIYAFGSDPQGLFAYQDSWDEYRYIPNCVKGKLADSTNNSYFPYTQSRYFVSQPNWGHEFSTTYGNVRNSMYTSSLEDICTMQVALNIRAVRPLPYRPTVGQIIN